MSIDAAPVTLVGLAALGYLLGSVPFGLLLTRAAGLGDIRRIGSGNIGATNVLRTGHKALAGATLLLDALKGAVAVVLGLAGGGQAGLFVAGLAAVLGHMFPVWLRFRGGKGVATGFGVLIAADPLVGLAAGAVWLIVAFATRYSSAGALASFVAAPVLAAAFRASVWMVLLAVAVAVPVWLRHRGNLERLLAGTEPRIGDKR